MRQKMKRGVSVLLAAVLLGTALMSCGGQKAAAPSRMKIGVVRYTQEDPFITALTEDFRKFAQQGQTPSISVLMDQAAGSQSKEDDICAEMAAEGCTMLLVNLVDRAAPTKIIDLAKEQNIPVIFYNREPVPEDLSQWNRLYYVGINAAEPGEMQGQMAAEYLRAHPEADRNQDGQIQYAVLEGETGHQDTIIRTRRAVDTLLSEEIPLDKVSYQVANFNRTQAENKVSQLIQSYGSSIELILSNNDEMAIGAAEAYRMANVTETDTPVVFGVDGTDEGLEALREGTIQGTIYNDKEGQAYAMYRMVLDIADGSAFPDIELTDGHYFRVPCYPVGKENVGSFDGRMEGLMDGTIHIPGISPERR